MTKADTPSKNDAEYVLTIQHKIVFLQILTNPSNEPAKQTKA